MASVLFHILSPVLIIYLSCSFSKSLVTTIDIKLEGNAVQSGVRQYSVHGIQQSTLLDIICILNTVEEPNSVSLLENYGKAENMTKISRGTRFTSQWAKQIKVEGYTDSRVDIYTCKALFSVNSRSAVDGSPSYSTIHSELEIVYVTEEQLIAFSVGFRAYTGENVTITCKGHSIEIGNSSCSRREEQQSVAIEIVAINNTVQNTSVEFDCDYKTNLEKCTYSNDLKCSCTLHSHIVISSRLALFITPSNFSSNVTTLQFTCTSDPPRLLGWSIVRDTGDVLDFGSLDDVIKVNMNITITERPGKTTLNISEASADGNSILLVICSSYGTPAKVIVSSYRVVVDKYFDGNTVTSLSPDVSPTTSIVESTGIPAQASTVYYESFHTIEEQLTEKTNPPNMYECKKPNFKLCYESMQFEVLLLFVIFLVCILAVVIVILSLLRKLRLAVARASGTTVDEYNKVASRTVLQDNPVYEPYLEQG